MRLLYVSHSLPPGDRPMDNIGGMQRVAADLLDSLARHPGVELRPLVLRSSWSERGYRTPVFLASALREIRLLVRRREVDAILFSSMVTATLTVPLRSLLRRSGIVTASIVNGLDVTTPAWPYPLFVRKAFSALDLVLPISRATGEACLTRGLDRKKMQVVSLGIRTDRFSRNADRTAARAKIIPPGSNPKLILCSVGRLVPRKGVAWFVSTVMPLLPDDVVYLVAGDGPERGVITRLVEQCGVAHKVRMLGTVTEEHLENIYHGADLFVMPNIPVRNDMEGFGLVMVEAGLSGLPVVASNIEGISDVITENENGHLLTAGDASAFVDAIMRYHSDRAALEVLGERARAHTISRFSWDAVTAHYVGAMDKLISARSAAAASS